MQQKILLIGGPGTGKTSVLNELIKRDYFCFPEISREVTLKAQQQGIEQMFLAQPLLFSQMLLEGREQQFIDAIKSDSKLVFFDRGIPDIHAYMDYFKTKYPAIFIEKSKQYIYDKVFHFSPWKDIHETDNERYETFEETKAIDVFLMKSYLDLGYNIIDVPFGSIDERTNFVLNSLSSNL
ncbi:ATP-binding protein [uncultured Polaribacter sp.]|mgnify:CR=1 FL=1|uniref:ATP-binding protein n=1 Tax=uncultured Polaribacter sp. TaxID=174711 RepID=UPI00262B59C6|nr:ATP-binding protein [uncultured Polaribacter sp.]